MAERTDDADFREILTIGGDGARLLAALSGLSPEEVRWTWQRTKALVAEGKTKAEAKAILKEEAKREPWKIA